MVKNGRRISVPTDRLLDALSRAHSDRPHLSRYFRSSYINDAKAIIDKAHRFELTSSSTTFQSLGTVPVDIQSLNATSPAVRSQGALRRPGVRISTSVPTSVEIEPKLTGWFAHEILLSSQPDPSATRSSIPIHNEPRTSRN